KLTNSGPCVAATTVQLASQVALTRLASFCASGDVDGSPVPPSERTTLRHLARVLAQHVQRPPVGLGSANRRPYVVSASRLLLRQRQRIRLAVALAIPRFVAHLAEAQTVPVAHIA